MVTLNDVCPTLLSYVDESKLRTMITNDSTNKDKRRTYKNKEPKLTTKKVKNALEMLLDVETNGGFVKIARKVGLSLNQVKQLYQEVIAARGVIEAEASASIPAGASVDVSDSSTP